MLPLRAEKTPARLNPPTSPCRLLIKVAPEDWNLSISLSIERRTPPSPAFFEAILYTNRIEKTSRKKFGGNYDSTSLQFYKDFILPIETKAYEKVSAADGRSLETFLKDHPKTTDIGIVVYKGREVVKIRKNIWAIPDWYLLA